MADDPIDNRTLEVMDLRYAKGEIAIRDEFKPFLTHPLSQTLLVVLACTLRNLHELAGARLDQTLLTGETMAMIPKGEKILQPPCEEYFDKLPTRSDHEWVDDVKVLEVCTKCGARLDDYQQRATAAYLRLTGKG